MSPQVEHRPLTVQQGARRLREQHLPAVGRAHHPRRVVHVQSHVALRRHGRRTDVQPHPHEDAPGRRQVLDLRRRFGGVRHTGEHDQERVALRVDLGTLVRFHRLPDDPAMFVEHGNVLLAEFTKQPC